MIEVTKINGVKTTLNAELIEAVEAQPDTVILLATGNRYVVRESVAEVREKVIEYKRKVHSSGRPVNPLEGYEKV